MFWVWWNCNVVIVVCDEIEMFFVFQFYCQICQIIVCLFFSMVSVKEISQYFKCFLQLDVKCFVVVKVGGVVLCDDFDVLIFLLLFLQEVGLILIVLYGVGLQLDVELLVVGIEKQIVNGLCVMLLEVLVIVCWVFQQFNLCLVEVLQQNGVCVILIIGGVFEVEYLDVDIYGLVGEVKKVNLVLIEVSLCVGLILVIISLGEIVGGQIFNVNVDFVVNELVQELQLYKIIFLIGIGGLLDEVGNVIDLINLFIEYDYLIVQLWIYGGMKVKIEQIKDLFDCLLLELLVLIMCLVDLVKELFIYKGLGMLVCKGEKVLCVIVWNEFDLSWLKGLIEFSFGCILVLDYFEKIKLLCVYVSENYCIVVIFIDEVEGVYLDKFVVFDDVQGEGLGCVVWNVMLEEILQLFWCLCYGNLINYFYYVEFDGCYKQDYWKVFWFGVDGIDWIKIYVDYCVQCVLSLQG